MAYCRNCGAYIPDGHTKCLACGLEQNQRDNDGYSSDSAAQADVRDSGRRNDEEMRRRLEEQRRRQQEENRKWAEAERRRQQREKNTNNGNQYSRRSGEGRPKGYQSNRLLAALSYIPALFLLPFIFCSDDNFAMYHARQGLILFAVAGAGSVLASAFGMGWIVTLMWIYWALKGIGNVNKGKMEPLPYIGNIFFKEK